MMFLKIVENSSPRLVLFWNPFTDHPGIVIFDTKNDSSNLYFYIYFARDAAGIL